MDRNIKISDDSKNKLFVIASGGLCNRLKPILSGMRVAAESGRELQIHWNEHLSMSALEYGIHPEIAPESKKTAKFPADWRDLFQFDIARCKEKNCVGKVITFDKPVLSRWYMGDCVARHVPFFLRFDDEPRLDNMHPARLS